MGVVEARFRYLKLKSPSKVIKLKISGSFL